MLQRRGLVWVILALAAGAAQAHAADPPTRPAGTLYPKRECSRPPYQQPALSKKKTSVGVGVNASGVRIGGKGSHVEEESLAVIEFSSDQAEAMWQLYDDCRDRTLSPDEYHAVREGYRRHRSKVATDKAAAGPYEGPLAVGVDSTVAGPSALLPSTTTRTDLALTATPVAMSTSGPAKAPVEQRGVSLQEIEGNWQVVWRIEAESCPDEGGVITGVERAEVWSVTSDGRVSITSGSPGNPYDPSVPLSGFYLSPIPGEFTGDLQGFRLSKYDVSTEVATTAQYALRARGGEIYGFGDIQVPFLQDFDGLRFDVPDEPPEIYAYIGVCSVHVKLTSFERIPAAQR